MSRPNVVVLTTDTTHHLYFVWKLAEVVPLAAIWLETRAAAAPFPTHHAFEDRRNAFERDVLLAGAPSAMGDVARVNSCHDLNEPETVRALRAAKPDAILVFGSGRLGPDVIGSAKSVLNLHGGDPSRYRGLDSHLWTIYHNDFEHLATTLHHVEPTLDTGSIVGQETLPLTRGLPLHELRAVNTRVCVRLCIDALQALGRGTLSSRKQTERGRYYSFMPAELKEICRQKFEAHTSRL